ncbi:Tn3 family transposase [Microtetraspora malaysiensis]|uniref:Tn3 family transposase n=1 Tax=Microtetraspora malaysiensis TaxID=161358 RepID=UPI003D93F96B
MLPRVDLPEVLLEVFSWTGADQAFTSVTGGETRLRNLHVTIAALLVAHGCNVGYTPVIGGPDALRYGWLSHVDQTYLRLETYRAANAALIDAQSSIPLAQAWGGGLVASVDGMRFVVSVLPLSWSARCPLRPIGRRPEGRAGAADPAQEPGREDRQGDGTSRLLG